MKTMKYLTILLMIVAVNNTFAQENRLRKKYVNFSFSKMEIKQSGMPVLKSDYGAALTVGRTYYLHKQPIAGMLRFGIDATWFDINYTKYKTGYDNDFDDDYNDEYDKKEFIEAHQAEIAMQVGPSLTLNPVGKLNLHAYFRYAPSLSARYADDSFTANYATLFVSGGAITWGAIGLGVETRFGNCKYKDFLNDNGENEENGEHDEYEPQPSPKVKISGLRAYITIRF